MRRKLSLMERGFWFRGEYCFNFAMNARIKGSFSVEDLKAALLKVRKKHPILGVRIEVDEDNDAWFNNENVPEFPIRIALRNNDEQWIQEVSKELLIPFSWVKGPLTRFTLLKSEDISDLIITCHHCNSDGLSAVYIIRDILFYIANPENEVELMPILPNLEDMLPDDVNVILPKKTDSKKIDDIKFQTIKEKPVKLFNEERLSINPWNLTQSQTSALISKCKDESVSVHSTICTIFLAAIEEIQPENQSKNRNIYSPVSIRNSLTADIGESYGSFFSSAIQTKLKYSKEKDFWKTAQMFQKRIKRQIKNNTLFSILYIAGSMDSNGFDTFFIQTFKNIDLNYGLTVSNLGNLHFPQRYGNFQLDAIYGPMMDVMHYEKTLSIATLGNQMYFTLTFRESIIDRTIIEKIRDKALEIINQLIS